MSEKDNPSFLVGFARQLAEQVEAQERGAKLPVGVELALLRIRDSVGMLLGDRSAEDGEDSDGDDDGIDVGESDDGHADDVGGDADELEARRGVQARSAAPVVAAPRRLVGGAVRVASDDAIAAAGTALRVRTSTRQRSRMKGGKRRGKK